MLLPRRNILIGAAALPLASVLPGFHLRIASAQAATKAVHGLAMHGEPKYGPDFANFDYVNPDAPKGGEIRLGVVGDTFATFNPFTLVNPAAAGAASAYETLAIGSSDEAFSEYGLLAETIEVPEERNWVTFTLRAEARWHDGKPVTAEDVVFSFETLKAKGHPFYRAYYASVEKAEVIGDRQIKFSFSSGVNRELPLIMGQLPVIPKHVWEGRDFGAATLEPPLGSGPYRIVDFESGRSVTLERVKDYWGAKLPVNVGQNNWDMIRYEYFRDSTVALEAFKAGQFDFRQENNSKLWATAYSIPQVANGLIRMEEIPNEVPTGMQGFAYNTRREIFKDPQVRAALAYAFDFEWSNKTLFYGQYTRTKSYFSNSELASSGLPSPEELQILEPYRGRISEDVFTTEYQPPSTDGAGGLRSNLRTGAEILKAAGWDVVDGKRVHTATGRRLEFEILLASADFERISQPFVQNLSRLGVGARIRTVDTAQYQNRMDSFDFDMTVESFGQSLSPGNEQRDFWGSASADTTGARNTTGIKDAVVDELIELVISAPDRESLITRTRALDRVLLRHYLVIPHWHITYWRVAYWDKFARPKITPKYSLVLDSWWVDAEKAAALAQKTN